ncbi:hypothetical protein L3X38_025686 [Prunus dulcis]|uniref:Uncharacterized protein n=1 Tax=Prunus dulcis TaxID=3755 RepID=A0AAD4W2B2_PRUDU|nr:hypothetical protein L3X38_025686 [Prunus dulcis]
MPRDGVSVYSPQGGYHANIVLVPRKGFLENLKMEDCLVSSGSILLGTKLLTFSLNSVLRGDIFEFC